MPSVRLGRRKLFFVLAVAVAYLVGVAGGFEADDRGVSPDPLAFRAADLAPAPDLVDGLQRLTRIDGNNMLVQTSDGDLAFLPGVNLGPAVPGETDTNVAADGERYKRWFPEIAAAGFQAIRVDRLRPAAFYRELKAFNEANEQDPLYLIHGVALPERAVATTRDLLHIAVRNGLLTSVEETVSAANGGGGQDQSGVRYDADVGPWLVGWVVGDELDPQVVLRTDQNIDGASFQGAFIRSAEDATATEAFLAESMNRVAAVQAGFGRMVPVAFGNTAITDPLRHHYEPIEENDLVQIDANNIVAADGWAGGVFASYEAYPSYPDFQWLEPGLARYRHNGQVDPYAGYLNQLSRHHSAMPVVVSSFGVPSGLATARSGPLGRDHGGLDEVTQMAVNAAMLRTVADLGAAGGFYASWVDEWHRAAWNTEPFEGEPERRAVWTNAWSADANFGLMAAEPGAEPTVVIDGSSREWTTNGSTVLFEGHGAVRSLRAAHDEGWLYLSLLVDDSDRLAHSAVSLGFDVIDGRAGSLPTGQPELAADYALKVSDGQAQLLVAEHSDAVARLAAQSAVTARRAPISRSTSPEGQWLVKRYGIDRPAEQQSEVGGVQASADYSSTTDEGLADLSTKASADRTVDKSSAAEVWKPHALVVREAGHDRRTGAAIPSLLSTPGELVRGTNDRNDPHFDSRATFQVEGNHLEVRLPWQGIGLSDPSGHRAYVVNDNGAVATSSVERILITIAAGGRIEALAEYRWERWNEVSWRQVPKNGLGLMSEAARDVLQNGHRPGSAPAAVSTDFAAE